MRTDRHDVRNLSSTLTSVGVLQGVSLGTGFATLSVIGATSGASDLGNFAFITSSVFLCSNLATLGFGQAALSNYARLSRLSWGQKAIAHQIKATLSAVLFTSALSCFLIGAIVSLTDVSPALFSGAIAWSLICPLLVFTGDQARALGDIKLGAILNTGGVNISPTVSSLALAVVLSFPQEQFTAAELALWALSAGGLATLMIFSPLVFDNLREIFSIKSRYRTRSLIMNSLPFAAARFAPIYQSGDIVIIGLVASAEVAGLYAAAARLASLVSFPLTLFMKTVSPTIASLWVSKNIEVLRRYTFKIISMSAVSSLVIATPLLAFPDKALASLFGVSLAAAAPYLLVLTMGRLISGCCGPTGAIMTAIGDGKPLAKSIIYTAILALAGGIMASITHGAVGVAYVFAAALVIQNGFQFTYLYSRLSK